MNHCRGNHRHNCVEELYEDHKKILGSFDDLEKALKENPLNKEKIRSFLEFTEKFSEPHHKIEEDILFPKLQEKGMPKEKGPIGIMLLEHETKRNYIQEIKKALEAEDEAKLFENGNAVILLMRDHIFKEDNILYPCAKDMISKEEMNVLGKQCSKIAPKS